MAKAHGLIDLWIKVFPMTDKSEVNPDPVSCVFATDSYGKVSYYIPMYQKEKDGSGQYFYQCAPEHALEQIALKKKPCDHENQYSETHIDADGFEFEVFFCPDCDTNWSY